MVGRNRIVGACAAFGEGTRVSQRVCTLMSIWLGNAGAAGITFRRKLFLSWTGAHRILKRYLTCILAGDPGRPVLPFLAGDGFGFGLSSTKWIFVGTGGG
jgi:hypothetical protein